MTAPAVTSSVGGDGPILVVTLGGTIAMTGGLGGVRPRGGAEVLDLATGGCGPGVITRTLDDRPGAHLSLDDIEVVAGTVRDALADGCRGAVVVQGTDTLEETAYALDLLVEGPASVVVTGAMRHASQPGADGPANVADALVVAAAPAARGLGALVVLGGEVHAAALVAKAHTSAPAAFRSAPGSLGWVVEGRLHLVLRPAARAGLGGDCVRRIGRVPPVPIVALAMGTGPEEALLGAVAALDPPGMAVGGLGGGHVPPHLVGPLGDLATDRVVVLASRTGDGPVLRETYGFAGSERDLRARGLVSAGPLSAPKARAALALLLAAGSSRWEVQDWFAELGPRDGQGW